MIGDYTNAVASDLNLVPLEEELKQPLESEALCRASMIVRVEPVGSLHPVAQCDEALAAAQIKYVIEHNVTVNARRCHRVQAWPVTALLAMTAVRQFLRTNTDADRKPC